MKINIQNYESLFLSYIDNELSSAEKKEVELFIKENPVYANELNSMKQAVLTAEAIIFEDKFRLYRLDAMEASLSSTFKKSLYRQEAKIVNGFFTQGRIKMIASVAAILFLLLGYKLFLNNPINIKEEYQTNSAASNSTFNSNNSSIVNNNPVSKNNTTSTINTEKGIVMEVNTVANTTNAQIENNPIVETTGKTETNNIFSSPEPTSNTATTYVASDNTINATVANNKPNNVNNEVVVNSGESTSQINETDQYTKLNVDDNDRSLYIANFEIDGEKLRGISRRINALFKRNKNEKQK